jgi:hypothetical protein
MMIRTSSPSVMGGERNLIVSTINAVPLVMLFKGLSYRSKLGSMAPVRVGDLQLLILGP